MGELISGKEALIALANGEDVEVRFKSILDAGWYTVSTTRLQSVEKILNSGDEFRIKPRTVTINGIKVPAPFEPKEGEKYWCFSTETVLGYGYNVYKSERDDRRFMNMGVWRTEEEIKQVVAVMKGVFNV